MAPGAAVLCHCPPRRPHDTAKRSRRAPDGMQFAVILGSIVRTGRPTWAKSPIADGHEATSMFRGSLHSSRFTGELDLGAVSVCDGRDLPPPVGP